MTQPAVDAVGWVLVRDRRLLAVRTAGSTAFYLPGGKREAGESDLEALAREVREEVTVNLLPDTLRLVGTFLAPAHGYQPGTMVELICYAAEFTGEIKAAGEIEEVAWLGPKDLEQLAPAVRLVVEELLRLGEM